MAVDFSRKAERGLHIEMTPLIDVVFQLLVFFMLTSVFAIPAIELDLPKLEGEPRDKKPSLVIHLNADQKLFINDTEVEVGNFSAALEMALETSEDRTVFFRGDRTATYETIIEIMQMSSEAGAAQFNFVYEPLR